jgi:hypothetical protein
MKSFSVMKDWLRNTITLTFFTAVVFVSVGSKAHSDLKCKREVESVLQKSNESLSVSEFEKEEEELVEPKLNLFITGGSLTALLH